MAFLFSKPLLYQFKKNNNYPKGTREVLTAHEPSLSAADLHILQLRGVFDPSIYN